MPDEQMYPVAFFGFDLMGEKPSQGGILTLCQMWVDQWGKTEWRPVPMININKERTPSIAGYVEDDDADST